MQINGISAMQQMTPVKPQAPTPPPGGNIENRQPPSEPGNSSGLQSGLQSILSAIDDSNERKSIDVYV